ncbi:MAG: hypothetical protein V4594_16170 [Bacteroidota bacterium]
MNKNFLTLPELELFFENKGYSYLNPNGVEIEMNDNFCASICIWTAEPGLFTIYAEFEEGDADMCRKLNLRSEADIDRIDEAQLWQHYLAGDGCIWVDMDEVVHTSLGFSVSGGMTQILSLDKSYADQVDEVWDTIDPFREYVRNNLQKIHLAVDQGSGSVLYKGYESRIESNQLFRIGVMISDIKREQALVQDYEQIFLLRAEFLQIGLEALGHWKENRVGLGYFLQFHISEGTRLQRELHKLSKALPQCAEAEGDLAFREELCKTVRQGLKEIVRTLKSLESGEGIKIGMALI